MSAAFVVVVGVLGAVIGSFANVVIYRLPRSESIVFPGSHCPHCGHRLSVLELVPILSFVALRGRCHACKAPIGWRYPLVEAVTAALFVAVALRWPPVVYGASLLPLLVVLAMLVMAAVIDLDHFTLPDALTLPALALAVAGSLLYQPLSGLPSPPHALAGAAVGAGVLLLINRLGALVLRRFADTRERLWPLSLDQANLAVLGGALGGWRIGLAVGAASVLLNLVTRRTLRLPEGPLYGLWAVALVLSTTSFTVSTAASVGGSVIAGGTFALVGAFYWWLHDALTGENASAQDGAAEQSSAGAEQGPAGAEQTSTGAEQGSAGADSPKAVVQPDPGDDEPVAMGFGDVKLAAVLGALLGWQAFLVALLLAVVSGAIGGIAARAAGGDRVVPFGPALVLGAVLALFFGHAILSWYLGLLGA
ncbi:MAG TPA: prepilin peptidase [Trueperaceae bacterium]|nr:prepilin peptidase [Trueperaceae bacterium]